MSFKGKMLVATPNLSRDPNFKRSVVYIYDETPDMIVGLTLNKPSDKKVSDLFASTQEPYSGAYAEPLFKGGPVSEQSLLLLHTDDWQSQNTMHIGNQLCLSSDKFMFEKMQTGNIPNAYRFFYGISSWHPVQLENEIHTHRAWLTTDANYSIVFNYEGEDQWSKALDHTSKNLFDQYI